MKISLCIPVYNEEKILPSTLQTVSSYMKKHFADDYEVLYINDGSKDRSAALIQAFAQKDSATRLIDYTPNRGKGFAVRQGILNSRGDVVIFTDCDLAYGLDVIEKLLDEFIKNPAYDVVVGSRVLHPEGYEGYTRMRRIVSLAYIRLLSLAGGIKLSDFQCGCKAFRGEIGKKIFSYCIIDRFAFDLEALLYAKEFGVKIGEMPVKIINHRESSVHIIKDSMRMLRDIRRMKKHKKKVMKEKENKKTEKL